MNAELGLEHDIVESCARELAAAHRAGRASARATVFTGISRHQAMRVQRRVLDLLGETANVAKVGIDASGTGIFAPIPSSRCGTSGRTLVLPTTGFVGIEIEIAARLCRDVTPAVAADGIEAVLAAIESFHIGVELVATRLENRDTAGLFVQLADGINTFGYVHSELPFPGKNDLSGALVEVFIDGRPLERQAGVSAFGDILNPIIAYGRSEPQASTNLTAGMLVTTGALSGLVPISGPANIAAGLAGRELVTFELCEGPANQAAT